MAGEEVRRRVRLDHRPGRVRRPRPARRVREGVERARVAVPGAQPVCVHDRIGMVAPTILAHGSDAAKQTLPHQDVPRRHRRLPAVQRARRRQRPGQPADQGRARRRRVGHHRPEGVDLRRPLQRHRRDHRPHRSRPAEAQGPDRVHRRHEGTRRRGAAAAADDRRRQLQRGVLQRGPRARRRSTRRPQQRLERRADDADERARRDRRRRRRGRRASTCYARVIEMVRHFGLGDDPVVRDQPRRPHHPRPGVRATTTSGRWTRSRPASCRARR